MSFFSGLLSALPGAVAQGLIWGLMAIGVFITFKVLDLADLTVDGTMATGGAVCIVMMTHGANVWVAMLCAFLAGMLAGLITGILHTCMGIPAILAGILTQLGLYSVNLHVMGKANVALLRVDTVFSYAAGMGLTSDMAMMAVGLVGVMLVGVILYWFFGTELGTAIRATGCNSQMARAQGVNTNSMIVLGLLISNALVALSGALVCQANGFADVGMGTGTIVIGLASVIIGEVLFGTRSFKNCLISVILGSIVYRLVIAIVLQLGMPPNDLKLFTAILVAIALSMPLIREKWRARKSAL